MPRMTKSAHQQRALDASFWTKKSIRGSQIGSPVDGDVVFYTHTLCPYAERVWITLQAKQIGHTLVHIDLSCKPAWFRSVSRSSLVPALNLQNSILLESMDIIKELDKQYEQQGLRLGWNRAAVQRIMKRATSVVNAGLDAVAGQTNGYWGIGRGQTLSQMQRFEQALVEAFELQLRDSTKFLTGDSVSLADCALYPFLWRFTLVLQEISGESCKGLLHGSVEQWLRDMQSLSFVAATMPAQEGVLQYFSATGRLDFFDYDSYDNPAELHPILRPADE